MTPVFVLLVIIGAVLLWFLLAFAFKFVGKIGTMLYDDVKDAMNEEDNDEKG